MSTNQFFSELENLLTDVTTGTKSRDEVAIEFMDKVRVSATFLTNGTKELALKVKKVRETQTAYFDSRIKGQRFGDKKILAESKRLEKELDQMTNEVLNQF